MTGPYPTFACILRFTLAASLLSLAAAFTAQYAFGLAPCHLCLVQRVPFAVVIALALLGWWKPRFAGKLVCVIGIAFLINSGIASYHTAVEKHWVEGPTDCTNGEAPARQSMDDFLSRIKNAPHVACDQPQWEFHGITMAGINAVWCMFLTVTVFAALRQARRKDDAHA